MRKSACSAKANGNARCYWPPPRRVFACCAVISSTVTLPRVPFSGGTLATVEAPCHWTTVCYARRGRTTASRLGSRPLFTNYVTVERRSSSRRVPITTIRKQLGHRNLQSTLLYAEVDQATVKRDLLEY